MPNLSLTFANLKPADFVLRIDLDVTMMKGALPQEYAAQQASFCMEGLKRWGALLIVLLMTQDYPLTTPRDNRTHKHYIRVSGISQR
jgi:hypothetical protein